MCSSDLISVTSDDGVRGTPVINAADSADANFDRSLDLSGAIPVAGKVYAVHLSKSFSYTATATDSLPAIASGLAAAIDSDSRYAAEIDVGVNTRINITSVNDVPKPGIDATYAELTTAQKAVVESYIDSAASPDKPKNYFNYNAPVGKKVVTDFTQGPAVDYSNADIYWGDAGAPAANAAFGDLTNAQKKVVARALGYEVYEGTTWYNKDAPADERLVTQFASGSAGDFDIAKIDWTGTRPPAADATFESLNLAQRAIVATNLGYDLLDTQVFYKASAVAGKQVLPILVQGDDYQNSTLNWGTVTKPADNVGFADLTLAQQERVLLQTGYSRWDGVVYHNAGAASDKQYVLSFEQGTGKDYENSKISWSAVEIPSLNQSIDLANITVTAGKDYTVTIGTTAFKYTSKASDTTKAHIVAGLVKVINDSASYGAVVDAAVPTKIDINSGALKPTITFSTTASGMASRIAARLRDSSMMPDNRCAGSAARPDSAMRARPISSASGDTRASRSPSATSPNRASTSRPDQTLPVTSRAEKPCESSEAQIGRAHV